MDCFSLIKLHSKGKKKEGISPLAPTYKNITPTTSVPPLLPLCPKQSKTEDPLHHSEWILHLSLPQPSPLPPLIKIILIPQSLLLRVPAMQKYGVMRIYRPFPGPSCASCAAMVATSCHALMTRLSATSAVIQGLWWWTATLR